MNEEVTLYVESLVEWQRDLSKELREVIHAAVPDVQERMQYKKPHFLKNGKYSAVISVSKDAISLTIFQTEGMSLPDEFAGPPERKTVKYRQGQPADTDVLKSLVAQASSKL